MPKVNGLIANHFLNSLNLLIINAAPVTIAIQSTILIVNFVFYQKNTTKLLSQLFRHDLPNQRN
jgi:hypothetical protein